MSVKIITHYSVNINPLILLTKAIHQSRAPKEQLRSALPFLCQFPSGVFTLIFVNSYPGCTKSNKTPKCSGDMLYGNDERYSLTNAAGPSNKLVVGTRLLDDAILLRFGNHVILVLAVL